MRKFIFFIFLFIASVNSFAQQFDEKYGKPLVVLIKTDPWLMVIGSDVPSFALYEKGQIIYKKIENGTVKYYEAQLKPDSVQAFINTLKITDDLKKLPTNINASLASDQPSNELLLNLDSSKMVDIYGNLKDDKQARDNTPIRFLPVYDKLVSYNNTTAHEWLPEKIEILLTLYANSPETPEKWPEKWPGLTDASTVKRNNTLYSVYLDKKYFADFKRLLKNLKEKQAVEIDGQKFSVSYRLPFPNIR